MLKETMYTIEYEDYAQSANSLFNFMKQDTYLKSILINNAIIPRFNNRI